MAEVSLYLRVRVKGKQQYIRPVWLNKKELKPLWGFAGTTPTHFPNGAYHLRYRKEGKRVWENVGASPDHAQSMMKERQWQLDNCGTTFATLKTINPDAPAPKPIRKTIADSIDVYLKDVAATKADKTIQGYTKDLSRFTASCSKHYVDEITADDLQEFVRFLRSEGLGKRSIYNTFQGVNTWLRVNEMWLGKPILKKLGQEYDEKIVDAYTKEETTALFVACDEEERLVYRFFLCSGCREGEVAHTEWQDLNFTDNTLHVQPKPHRGWKVKDREDRYVPLPADLMAELKERKGSAGRNDLIFPNGQGGAEGHFLRKLKEIVKRLDRSKFRWCVDNYSVGPQVDSVLKIVFTCRGRAKRVRLSVLRRLQWAL